MRPRVPNLPRLRAVLLAAGILVAGLALGYLLAVKSAPPTREPALLWDDYILAVAALYQRDGDLAAARQRLESLAIDDPGTSVSALAAIYVADGRLGESQTTALRDLALALTGRAPQSPPVSATSIPAAVERGPFDGLSALARNQMFWLVVAIVSGSLLATTYFRARRPTQSPGEDLSPAAALTPEAGAKAVKGVVVPLRPRIAGKASPRPEPVKSSTLAGSPPAKVLSVTRSFLYDGGSDAIEEMVPVTDPLTGRMVAGCGLTNGPRAGGADGGYVGFLVWLHELGSHELPQTLGLIADGSGEACKAAIGEWADYARVDELVVARPGVIRTFESRRLQAAVSIVDLAQARPGKAKYKVFRRIEVRLDIALKDEPAVVVGTR